MNGASPINPNKLQYQASKSAVYYTPPRQFHPKKTLKGVLRAMAAVIVGGAVYALVLPYITSETPRVAAVVTAALAIGILTRKAVQFGKVLSPAIGAIIGAFLGLLALYVMWLVWLYRYLHPAQSGISLWFLLVHPVRFVEIIQSLVPRGTLIYGNDIIKGPELVFIWLMEAGAMLGSAVLFGVKAVGSSQITCAKCSTECKQACRPGRFAVDRQDEMIAAIEARDFASLATYPPRRNENDPELALRLVSCPNCAQTNVLSLTRIAWGRQDGKRAVISTPLVNQLLITAQEAEHVKKCQNIGEIK